MSPAPTLLARATAEAPTQSAAGHPSPDSRTRNAAVDFFRGLGLWIVFIDHVRPNMWSHLTLWRFGFSDFVEIFVFLSGFISFGSYERALATGHASNAIKKLAHRIGRLYTAHIASLTVSLLLLAAFAKRGLLLDDANLYVWMQDPAKYALRMLALQYIPILFTVLPLYILVSPVSLLAALGLRRAPQFTLWVSGVLWLASQFPAFASRTSSYQLYFYPLAWQFLFVLGAAARYYSHRLKPFALSQWTIRTAAVLVAGTVALKSLTLFPWTVHLMSEQFHAMLMRDSGKPELAPYRLVHFLALLVLVHALTHDRVRWLQSSIARRAIACGAGSLFIYSCTLVLDEGARLLLASTRGGAVPQLTLTIFGVALLAGLGWLRRGQSRYLPLGRSYPLLSQIRNSNE